MMWIYLKQCIHIGEFSILDVMCIISFSIQKKTEINHGCFNSINGFEFDSSLHILHVTLLGRQL